MEQTTDPTTRIHEDGSHVPPGTPFADAAAPTVTEQQKRPRFRLHRSRTDRMLGGVCGGLAESLEVDAMLLRVALVALTVLGAGSGVVLYLAVWFLAPEGDAQ